MKREIVIHLNYLDLIKYTDKNGRIYFVVKVKEREGSYKNVLEELESEINTIKKYFERGNE